MHGMEGATFYSIVDSTTLTAVPQDHEPQDPHHFTWTGAQSERGGLGGSLDRGPFSALLQRDPKHFLFRLAHHPRRLVNVKENHNFSLMLGARM